MHNTKLLLEIDDILERIDKKIEEVKIETEIPNPTKNQHYKYD